MVLQRQILFNVAIAEAILMRTSAEQVLSLHRIAPIHLKLVTSSDFWPFMLIFALILFMLLVAILLFSVLTYSESCGLHCLVILWHPLFYPRSCGIYYSVVK